MSASGETIELSLSKAAMATPQQRREMLKQAVDEMVGVTFFGQMLKMSRNSVIKGEYGHGGRGEEIFGSQLDAEFSRCVAQGMSNSLNEVIYNRMVKRV